MKFVALVSGGKDSCFSIVECISNGHELVALANLSPPPGTAELDSYMFQTVGSSVLDHYSLCIGVPMYRQVIKGTSKNIAMEYETTPKDETEDLYTLLEQCKRSHPGLEAVSVGAILSSYQRIRVEHVCSRLGLVSLAYLWQRNQSELMREMSLCMDARIIKVAAIGLDSRHLGMTLAKIYPILESLNRNYGVHVCGEGGEFETLVLDAPFFKKSLVVVGEKVVNHGSDVYFLEMDVKVEEKAENDSGGESLRGNVGERPLLTGVFKEIYSGQEVHAEEEEEEEEVENEEEYEKKKDEEGHTLYFSNITSDAPSLELQTSEIIHILRQKLALHSFTSANVISSTLLVSSMSDFAKVNTIYGNFFINSLPPARTCIETTLPSGCFLKLSCTAIPFAQKKGLHVQGRSYWAPANIGPYSQANWDINGFSEFAGQIPLIPKSMTLCDSNDILLCALLSLKHLDSVMKVTGFKKLASCVCYVTAEEAVTVCSDVFRQYSNGSKELVIVKVKGLPKGASIEWGGSSSSSGKRKKTTFVSSLKILGGLEGHCTVYGKIESLQEIGNDIESVDTVPVDQVFDYKGSPFEYAVIES